MPEGRLIKRKITDDYRLNILPVEARLLFRDMILWVDREGRLQADPKWVNRRFFPMDNFTDEQVADWLNLLHESKKKGKGLIELYEVDGFKYLWLPGFEREQSKGWTSEPHGGKWKEAESSIPPPPSSKEGLRHSKPVETKAEKPTSLIPTPFEEQLLDVLKSMPSWEYDEQKDLAWLRELTGDYPNITLHHLKSCKDRHSSKKEHDKGQWKTRIRNWLRLDIKFEKEAERGAHRGSHGTRQLPKTYRTPEEHFGKADE